MAAVQVKCERKGFGVGLVCCSYKLCVHMGLSTFSSEGAINIYVYCLFQPPCSKEKMYSFQEGRQEIGIKCWMLHSSQRKDNTLELYVSIPSKKLGSS